MGKLLFYILWPLIWVYAPLTRRVRVVIIGPDNKVLLIKNRLGPGALQLPGGGIKIGETAEAAAERELLEELGLKAKVELLTKNVIIVKQFGLLMRYNFAQARIKQDVEPIASKEIKEILWVSRQSLPKVANEVKVGLSLVEKQG